MDNTGMSEPTPKRIVPLLDLRAAGLPIPPAPAGTAAAMGPQPELLDLRGRKLNDLRISVTDRCNFRCSYCMPKDVFTKDYPYLPHSALLTFEEITRIAKQCVAQGVQKIRLTGGEPLLRKGIEILIEQLAALRTPLGERLDLTLTTNGALLARKAKALKAAGLNRLTVSLDGLDDGVFRAMNDVDFPVQEVLDGIAAARDAGLGPIKVNMVVKRGTNDQQILAMAQHFRGTGIVLRYIEYMDVGATNGWRMDDVLPSAELIQRLQQELPLVALQATQRGETAQRWGYANADGQHDPAAGEIGVISSVTQAFCSDCNRARLSTEGQLYLCLFASQGYNLRELVRGQHSDAELGSAIARIWSNRSDRYSELRGSGQAAPAGDGRRKVEMSYIGG
jgi:cyclic pyranopterin phosphate synthase